MKSFFGERKKLTYFNPSPSSLRSPTNTTTLNPNTRQDPQLAARADAEAAAAAADRRRRRRHPVAEVKGQWTEEEDAKLRALVAAHGEGCWSRLVDYFPGRIGKQLRERWNHELAPNINKDAWSREEEAILVRIFFFEFFFPFEFSSSPASPSHPLRFFQLFFNSQTHFQPSGRRPRPRGQLLGGHRPPPPGPHLQRREKPLERHPAPLRPRRPGPLRAGPA